MKVFVSGATGFIGRHVLRELKSQGHTPMILARPGSEKKLDSLEGVILLPGDISQPSQYAHLMTGADAVIHLVGIIRQFPSRGISFDLLHRQATGHMLAAARQAGVKRFIHMSANGAAADGVSEYQTSKWHAEELVKNSGMRWTIFRPSVIFGDAQGLPEFTSQLADIVRQAPMTPIFGQGDYLLDPVAVGDVARCMVAALKMDNTIGKSYCMGGGAPISFAQIIQIVGKATGRPKTRTISIPLWLMLPLARALGGFSFFPVTADQILMLIQGNVCEKLDYMETFGITPLPFTYKNLAYLAKE